MTHTLTFAEMYGYDHVASGITVPVLLSRGQENEKTLAKVDTGASYCIFKREHGEALGLDIESGIPESISAVTESFLAYGHYVSLSALDFRFEVLVYFAAKGGFPRNVLGRRGWIEKMRLGIIDYDRQLYASLYDDA